MSTPSNLYAEKVFAEHPLSLWALDDKLDYLNLITEAQRNIGELWDGTGGGSNLTISPPAGIPFPDSFVSTIYSDVPSAATHDVSTWSPNLVNLSTLNQDLGSFAVGTYLYCDSAYMNSVSIGYEYTDPDTSETVRHYKTFQTSITQVWIFVSETFEIPNVNADLRAFISINVNSGGETEEAYRFYINGITVGQWSEEFNATSLGVELETIPSNISIYGGLDGVEANAYGLSPDSGYYVGYSGAISRNTSLPLVFGSSNVTRLLPAPDASFIVPGKGFLNKKGQFLDYTVEFWARIDSSSYTDKRIFGPISSTDGLYVNSGFLTLVIGNSFASHFVGEWFRPMLIQIRVIRDSASLLINGEQVISFLLDTGSLSFPDELDADGKNQDWLGFYSYNDVSPFEIDCVGIYPYQVPINIAKKRWVYGQAVISPESINASYNGSSVFIDYPFANYTANYSYPNLANWSQGTFDNLGTTSSSLTTPNYSLPDIFLGTKTLEELYSDNKELQDEDYKFITFRPSLSWDENHSYFNFQTFNVLNDEIHGIFGVFSSEDLSSVETLFKIYNPTNGNFFSVRKNLEEIRYYLSYNGVEEEVHSSESIISGEKFSAGFIIDNLVSALGGNVATFFGNRSSLRVYVAGEESPVYSFTGKIYSFGFCTKFNVRGIEDHFDESTGILPIDTASEIIDHIASYTLMPVEEHSKYYLDISSFGYWEDYIPLSYFGKYIKDKGGEDYYDLDFLQFNIDYPSTSLLSESSLYYDTTNAFVRTYVTFQYIVDGANKTQGYFTNYEPVTTENVIDVDLYEDWATTKFEIMNGTVLYPRKTIDFNKIAIVFHVEFYAKGIIKKPLQIKKLEISSQALNSNSFNPIGTRLGLSLFPYKKSGIYFDYKTKNPFSIYKGSSPYLYLTKDSGIKIRGEFSPDISRGVAISVNDSKSASYQVNAMQLWMRYDEAEFTQSPLELFEIKYKEDTIKFYFVADTSKNNRATIYAKSVLSGENFQGLAYYVNGNLVREPKITLGEWISLGISFSNSLNFDSYIGAINLNGPMVFNNISYYQANSIQQLQKNITRSWIKVKNDGLVDLDWQYWVNDYIWQEVLVVASSNLYATNPDEIYNTYTGTNKIIVDDSLGMSFNADKIKIYTETVWQTTVKTPA